MHPLVQSAIVGLLENPPSDSSMFTFLDFIGHVPYFPMIFPSKSSLMTPKVTPEDMIFSYFQQV
jgi:hypothetical protein